MARAGRSDTELPSSITRRERMRTKAGGDSSVRWCERVDLFHDPYLADPYPFFAEARAAVPVFYSPDLDYGVVTRYHDIRQIFQTPKRFSAVNLHEEKYGAMAPSGISRESGSTQAGWK